MTNVCIIATIVIYLVGMLLVGFVYSKSNEDSYVRLSIDRCTATYV